MFATEPAVPHARTKIVATLGPASSSPEMLAELVTAGADVFRINMAHGVRDEHEALVRRIRRTSESLGVPIAILVDLAGPKIRLRDLPGGQLQCELGQKLRIVRGRESKRPDELTTNYAPLVDELHEGNRVMLADAAVGLIVESCGPGYVECRVTQAGLVRSHQGVNLPGAKLSVPSMGAADRQAAVWAASIQADYVGLSFVRRSEDVEELKSLLKSHRSCARVVAKIEKPEALAQLEEIVAASDGVMVARGDLGVEIDVAEVPLAQKRIIATGNRLQRPVIVATQMLESMERSPWPTRAEVTDVANAILDGCDACMLSGETAIGQFPRQAVAMINRVALVTESRFLEMPPQPTPAAPAVGTHPITQAMVMGAEQVARHLSAKLVVVASHSGASALAMSKRRSYSPVVGVSNQTSSLRQMRLFWGVTPLANAPVEDLTALKKFVNEWGVKQGILSNGDCVVLLAGSGVAPGSHNLLEVHRV